jgi:hypothetical protein
MLFEKTPLLGWALINVMKILDIPQSGKRGLNVKATDKVGTGSADLRQPVGALCFERVSWVTEELVWAGNV